MADVAPEAIYHLAAMTHVGESWENPSQVLRVNVLGTAELLAAARIAGRRRPPCWWSARPRSTGS
jgi:GDP-D-mannose dehydratase